ncbi:MAG TPA: LemA family protein [Nocardioidaceae bacterium]
MIDWTWVVTVAAVLALVLAVGLWLSWTAQRLNRLHHRLEVARGSLETQLLRRSGATVELATSGALDPARSLLLVDAAHHARAVRHADMETAESDLSQALRAVFSDADEVRELRSSPDVGPLLDELAGACRKIELARRFHNDVVTSTRALRSRRRVRWMRLAGRAPEPVTVDLDDTPPPALVAD